VFCGELYGEYMYNYLVQNNWPNFVSEHLMFLPMFCDQTFVNAYSAKCLVLLSKCSPDLYFAPNSAPYAEQSHRAMSVTQ